MAAKKSNAWLVVSLGLLTLAFLLGNVWQYWHNRQTTTVIAQSVAAKKPVNIDQQQLALENTISHLSGNLLLLTDSTFNRPIPISRPITINRDTLFIKTKGHIVLMADSGYNGVAFLLSKKCKLVLLDSMVLSGFKTGVTAYNGALSLKKVRFENCEVAVQNLLTSASNNRMSGSLQALTADSIAINH